MTSCTATKPVYIAGKKHSQTPLGLLPWVTAILGETSNKAALLDWEKRVGYVEAEATKKAAIKRGKELDKNIKDFFNTGTIANDKLFTQAWHVIKEFDCHLCWQKFIYHPAGYCGRLDYIGQSADGSYTLIDWKSSEKAKIDKFMVDPRLQVVANIKAAEHTLKIPIACGEVVVCIAHREVSQRFPITLDEIEPLWQEFLERLDQYRTMTGGGF